VAGRGAMDVAGRDGDHGQVRLEHRVDHHAVGLRRVATPSTAPSVLSSSRSRRRCARPRTGPPPAPLVYHAGERRDRPVAAPSRLGRPRQIDLAAQRRVRNEDRASTKLSQEPGSASDQTVEQSSDSHTGLMAQREMHWLSALRPSSTAHVPVSLTAVRPRASLQPPVNQC
jgi:hypothetical protein